MRIFKLLPLLTLSLLLIACGQKVKPQVQQTYYDFNNLITTKEQDQLVQDLKQEGLPSQNWDTLLPYINRYNQENTDIQKVVKTWTKSKIGEDQNDFITFLNEKEYKANQSHFTDDLNCRRTSFILLHNLITSKKDLSQLGLAEEVEFSDLKSRHKELTATDQQLYSLLFGDNLDYQSTDDLLAAWKKAGLQFPKKIKLLSVFQNSPSDVSNFHTAIAYEKDGYVYVFEKQDPTLPYRWSRFDSWADLKLHWLSNRFEVFKDNIDILINDQKFDDFLKENPYKPLKNQPRLSN